MNVAVDEYGNPILLIREQETKKRVTGIEAQKANIVAALSLANSLRSSLGPRGMDKILISPDGDVTVSNDGRTILSQMEVENKVARLLVELSESQDDEIGDGTTGIVIFVGALLEQALKLLDKGLHALTISDGFDKAASIAIHHLDKIAKDIDINDSAKLAAIARTSLGSKVVMSSKDLFAKIAVEAVMSVADLERRDVNFDLIKIDTKAGGRIEDSRLINGIILDKDLSHPHMNKTTENAKIAILTCPFEPPKPKTKHKLSIESGEEYKQLATCEQGYFNEMIKKCQDANANFVICQWGFDDEANHLLYQNNIPAVRWVGGVEMELIAIATGGKIVGRFEDLNESKLGRADVIKEVTLGTEKDQLIFIENCSKLKAVSVLIRGSNKVVIEEAKRSLHDAICCVRNMIRSNRVVCGGGSADISMSIAVDTAADQEATVHQMSMRAFGEALLCIPDALADNSGLNSLEAVRGIRARQISENNSSLGIDCLQEGKHDMDGCEIYESFIAKRHQIELGLQVVKMIMKIDDIIIQNEMQE